MYKFKDTTPISTEPTTVSGSIVTIDNNDDVLGVKSLVTEIKPIQGGSGTPSPSNVRAISGRTVVNTTRTGKNLFKASAYSSVSNGITFTVRDDGTVTVSGTATANAIKNLGFYTLPQSDTAVNYVLSGCPSGGNNAYYVDCRDDANAQVIDNTGNGKAFTSTGQNTHQVRIVVASGTSISTPLTFKPMIRIASSDVAYEPANTETYTTDLERTVYGGTLDMSTGLLTVTHAMVDMGALTWSRSTSYAHPVFYATISAKGTETAGTLSSAFNTLTQAVASASNFASYSSDYDVASSNANTQVYVRWDAKTDATSFKTAVTGQTLVYPLATPQVYMVAPTSVELIAGDNSLWSDSGNITATYEVDESLYYSLPTEAVSINGRYLERIIDGYRTLYVEGRESLGIELDTYSVGTADGVRLRNRRYPARELKVGFQLIAGTAEEFRQRFNQLNNILSIGEADFIFNDERDKFFSGYPVMDANIETGTNSVKGEWTIYCAYPFKRSLEPITLTSTDDATISGNSATFTFNYGGVIPAKPVLRCEFASAKSGGDYNEDGDCGYVAFLDANENIIQLGNPDVIDLDATNKNATLINSTFDALTGWTASGMSVASITDPQWNDGAGQTQSYAKGVGHLRRTFTGALNFEWDMVHRLAVSDPSQTGTFKVLLKNGNTTVIGYTIEKTGSGTAGTVKYWINGSSVGKDTIDLSLYNPSFGFCNKTPVYVTEEYYVWVKRGKRRKKVKKTRQVQKGWEYTQSNLNSGISRNGGVVTFSIGNLADRTFKRSEIDTATITSVSIETTGNLGTNAIRSASLVSKKGVAFNQIPNVFTAGDICEADCNDANVYLYRNGSAIGHLEPQYGALGNDWENFEISVGTNVIRAVWSPWVNASYIPVIKIIFNEVSI